METFKSSVTEHRLDSPVVLNGIGKLRDFKIGWLELKADNKYETSFRKWRKRIRPGLEVLS